MTAACRKFRSFAGPCLAAVLVTSALAPAGRAAIATGPPVKGVSAKQQFERANLQAEMSLSRQIEVGRERYQQKLAYRRQIIQGMEAALAARKQTVRMPAAPPGTAPASGTFGGPLAWVWVAIFLVAGLAGLIYLRHRERARNAALEPPAGRKSPRQASGATRGPSARLPDNVWVVGE